DMSRVITSGASLGRCSIGRASLLTSVDRRLGPEDRGRDAGCRGERRRRIRVPVNDTQPPACSPLDDPAHVPVTLTARVAEQVRDAIADGRLQPNMRLSVPQLAEQLGASRTPVREALLLLESQGVVRFE